MTRKNAESLAQWLGNARFYISKYRPVPIKEHLVFDNCIFLASSSKMFYTTASQVKITAQASPYGKPEPTRIIKPSESLELKCPLINAVVALANETVRSGYGALVFCSSRTGCERDATLISQVLPLPEEIEPGTREKRNDLINDLRSRYSSTHNHNEVHTDILSQSTRFHHRE